MSYERVKYWRRYFIYKLCKSSCRNELIQKKIYISANMIIALAYNLLW